MALRLPFFKPKAAYADTSGLDATTAKIWNDAFGGIQAKAGVRVNATTALASNAIAACIAVRARTLSSLPVHVYKVGSREKADKHPTAAIFRGGPNEYMTWAQAVKLREMSLILTGNSYWRKTFVGGRVVGFEPLYGVVKVTLDDDGKLFYEFDPQPGGETERIPASQILHHKWDILDSTGLVGRSVVDLAREAIGLDISAEEFLGRVLSNGTHMGTVLTTDAVLSPDQMEQLRLQLSDGAGVAPANKARVFSNGLKPMVLGSNVADTQLEEQRRFINEKISALCGVPLSLLNDLTHGTYSNVEQMSLSFAKFNVLPSVIDFEQTLNKQLFMGRDAGQFYVKFSLQGLERGDFLSRMQGYETGIRIGMWSPNECREWEDQDPYEGGDEYVMQAQMTPVGDLGKESAPAIVPDEELAIAALAPLVLDAHERIGIRARIDSEKKRDKAETQEWARVVLRPLVAAHAVAGVPFDAEAFIAAAIGGLT